MENHTDIPTEKPYKIGYALSGGFIKGFAHLGVMQALLEHDIKPNIISGVSAGALAGCAAPTAWSTKSPPPRWRTPAGK